MSKFHGRAALGHLRRNAVAYLALTIALGGTSYAAVEMPRNSVGTDQIRANAVGPSELRAGSVRSSEIKDGELRLRDFKTGELPAGPQGPPGDLTGTEVGGDLTGTLPNPRLATQPAVRVEDDTQVELDSATGVLMELDDEVFDTAEMHPGDGRDDRIRVPRTGTYVLNGEVEWQPNDNGYRTLDLMQAEARRPHRARQLARRAAAQPDPADDPAGDRRRPPVGGGHGRAPGGPGQRRAARDRPRHAQRCVRQPLRTAMAKARRNDWVAGDEVGGPIAAAST